MQTKQTKYRSKPTDELGFCTYTEKENHIWKQLYERQIECIQNRACDEYIEGVKSLNISSTYIPQCPEISKTLQKKTGWSLEPVPALIAAEKFFKLLATKRFPAATFIRIQEELDYVEEPDIFHEIFGHCPLLTNNYYADFVEQYGQLALKATPKERSKLLRLFWLTIEFGLINTPKGLRIYGGGILSSPEETRYALESEKPKRLPLNLLDMLRTPYRIDIKQPIYYIINSFEDLHQLLTIDIMSYVKKAIELGDFEPEFPPKT